MGDRMRGRGVHEGAGKPATAMLGVGLDRLVAGEAPRVGDDPQRAAQRPAIEGSEPPAVAALGQRPRRGDLARQEVVVCGRVPPLVARDRDTELKPRRASRRPPASVRMATSRGAGCAGAHQRARAHPPWRTSRRAEVRRVPRPGRYSVDAVDADEQCSACGNSLEKSALHAAASPGAGEAWHEDEVAPPEGRVRQHGAERDGQPWSVTLDPEALADHTDPSGRRGSARPRRRKIPARAQGRVWEGHALARRSERVVKDTPGRPL